MSEENKPVLDHPAFVRTPEGVLSNVDQAAFSAYINHRNKVQADQIKIKSLEDQVDRLAKLVEKLVGDDK